MLTILHGDNVTASRRRLGEIKDKNSANELVELNGRNINVTDLIQAVTSNSLYGADKLVVIENLVPKGGKKSGILPELERLFSGGDFAEVVWWEERELSSSVLKPFSARAKIETYKLSVSLWKFLDSFIPATSNISMDLLKETLGKEEAELIWPLLGKRIYYLTLIKLGVMPQDLKNWQAGRLTIQTKLFTMEKLLEIGEEFTKMEYEYKTGQTAYSMREMLEKVVIQISNHKFQ